jgi:hypothetical protein
MFEKIAMIICFGIAIVLIFSRSENPGYDLWACHLSGHIEACRQASSP